MVDLTDVDFDPFGNSEPVVDTGYLNTYYVSLDSFYKRLQGIVNNISICTYSIYYQTLN